MTNNTHAGDGAPRPSTTTPIDRPRGVAGKVNLRAGSADAVLAVVPHMLGFYPSQSLVVLGLGERNLVRVTFRYDLPSPPDAELSADIAEHAKYVLTREGIPSAMLIGYGPADLVVAVIAAAAESLIGAGVRLQEVLRAEAGRYWSMLCNDPMCCPPEGSPYDPGSHPAAAAMTAAGLTAHPDRAALVRTLQSPAGISDQVRQATNRARMRLAQVAAQSQTAGHTDPQLRVVRIGRTAVQRAIHCYRSGGSISGRDQLAWLAVLLADLRVRDDAWARMDPTHHAAHCRLWTDVVKGAAPEFVPAPASLLAFAAWQAGNGALAAVAVDRALAANPDYSMAMLLLGAIEAGLPPSAAKMPMSPAQVAASYAPVTSPARARTKALRNTRRSGSTSNREQPARAQPIRAQPSRAARAQSAHGRGLENVRGEPPQRRRRIGQR